MKKFHMAITIALVLTLMTCSIAYAEIEDIRPYSSDLLLSYRIPISCSSTGLISATAKIETIDIVAELGFPLIQIQEKQGTSWETVKEIEKQYKTKSDTYSYKLTYQGTAGKQYRAYAEYRAKDGSIEETRSKYSSTVTGK